jgi:hypothetical protein
MSELIFNVVFFRLRIKVRYDDNFKAKFGADAANTARRVMAQVSVAIL